VKATTANVPSSLRIQSEPRENEEDATIDEFSPANDTDMYLLIHKIQTDISEHEALMGRILRRDAEYDMMKKSYEQKMDSLHHQLHSTLKERDKALKLLKDPLKNKKEAHQALSISTKYEEKKRKLEIQLNDYRRKLEGSTRHYHENKSRNEALTKDLKATIESMKGICSVLRVS
jgi:septal ring factor EnvC (AmiA/AmiB activator)